jgi:excisionase family DNA binding protein
VGSALLCFHGHGRGCRCEACQGYGCWGQGVYYTTRQVADALRLNPSTIVRWCQSGYLPALLLGGRYRIDVHELEAWLAARRNVSRGMFHAC